MVRNERPASVSSYWAPEIDALARMGSRVKHPADAVHVRTVMGDLALSGPLSMARVARALDVSPRTLQRRLASHDITFRDLVRDVHLEMARTLLIYTDLSIQEISERVGYRTPGAFTRAFLARMGRTPREFRKASAAL